MRVTFTAGRTPIATPIRLLLVEPDTAMCRGLAIVASRSADVDTATRFDIARGRLTSRRYDLLVANLRLGPYNGLHLVHVAKSSSAPVTAIVHDQSAALAREIQRNSAFFEVTERLVVALPAYVSAALPRFDRRNPAMPDRRSAPRGGRRAWDHHVVESFGMI